MLYHSFLLLASFVSVGFSQDFCDIDISGKSQTNTFLNDRYYVSGTLNDRPLYANDDLSIYIYYLPSYPSGKWYIGQSKGSTSALYGVADSQDQSAETAPWQFYQGGSEQTLGEVTVACRDVCSSHTSCGESAYCTNSGECAIPCQSCTASKAIGGSCPECPKLCDIEVSGKTDSNSHINGEYIFIGFDENGYPYYEDSTDSLFLYFYEGSSSWFLGNGVGSNSRYAYAPDSASSPDQIQSNWFVYDGQGTPAEPDVRSVCAFRCSAHSECGDNEYCETSGKCVKPCSSCTSSHAVDGSCPTCPKLCDVEVSGKTGSNSVINGEYIFSGFDENGNPYYEDNANSLFIYYYDGSSSWFLGNKLGGNSRFAYATDSASAPDQIQTDWFVYNGKSTPAEPDVRSVCAFRCSAHSECGDNEYCAESGECIKSCSSCTSSQAVYGACPTCPSFCDIVLSGTYSILDGDYAFSGFDSNGNPYYAQTDTSFLIYLDEGSSSWLVGNQLGGNSRYAYAEDTAGSPDKIQNDWLMYDGHDFVAQSAVQTTCAPTLILRNAGIAAGGILSFGIILIFVKTFKKRRYNRVPTVTYV